jgi:ABC-type hemin transport system substrate-binding protein
VCALGVADRLVGVTRYCTDPADVVATLPKLGGTKNPDLAAISSLKPDLVLMDADENRREDFSALVDRGLTVFVSHPRTVAEAAHSIERIAIALARDEAGAVQRAAIEEALRDIATGESAAHSRRRVFCPIWRNPWMGFNRDTFAHDVIAKCGGTNVCADAPQRYPRIELAAIAALDPQVILLPDEPYRFSRRDLAFLAPLRETSALRLGEIHFVDGKALFWYGPRTAAALRSFRRLLQR